MPKLSTINKEDEYSLGQALKNARLHKNLTQQQMADALGVSKAVYRTYEAGLTRISASMLLNISEQLEIPVEMIVNNIFDEKLISSLSVIFESMSSQSMDLLYKIANVFQNFYNDPVRDELLSLYANLNESGKEFLKNQAELISKNPAFTEK